MTNWEKTTQVLQKYRDAFNRSYKCIHNREPSTETKNKHLEAILYNYNSATKEIFSCWDIANDSQKEKLDKFQTGLKTRTEKILIQFELKYSITNLIIELSEESDQNLKKELSSDEDWEEEEEDLNLTTEITTEITTEMTQTVEQFVNLASKFLTDFDGKSTNLQSFVDGLETINQIKGTHEELAISLIKTKLKDSARQLITTESTITEIINTLKNSIKGESVDNLTAKLMNIQQKNKTANSYSKEVEELAKAIQGAYISDGVPSNIASKYATKAAVNAMVKNCNISEVKLIMKSGQFTDLNAVVQKFVESCTDATGKSDTILFYNGNNRGNYYRGRNRPNRGRQFSYRGTNYPNNRGNYNNGNYRSNRGNRGSYRGSGNNQGQSSNHVRHMENVPQQAENHE